VVENETAGAGEVNGQWSVSNSHNSDDYWSIDCCTIDSALEWCVAIRTVTPAVS